MGFKATLAAVGPGVPREDVLGHPEGGPEAAVAAAERLFPGRGWVHAGSTTMDEGCYPGGGDALFVSTHGPTTVLGGPMVLEDREALFAGAARAGLMAWTLDIHSVVDLCAFEVRSTGGSVVRRLEMTADTDPGEVRAGAVGEPLAFEEPYWAREHALDGQEYDDYLHPFHPLELGEAAIAWIFGTRGEGAPPDRVQDALPELTDLFELPMHRLQPAPVHDAGRRRGVLGRLLGR